MKWHAKEHELDRLAKPCGGIRRVWFYGATAFAASVCESFLWVVEKAGGTPEDFDVRFVDRDEAKQQAPLCGRPVFSPETFWAEFAPGSDIAVLLVNEKSALEIAARLPGSPTDGIPCAFSIEEFTRFCPVLIWLRYQKLYFWGADNFMSSHCNLRCENCIIRHTHRQNKRKLPPEEVLRHLDEIFEKVDFVGELIYGIADGLAYDRLPELLDYAASHYGGRIQKITLITNGTIMPKPDVLDAMKRNDVYVVVDDYRAEVPLCRQNYERVLAVLRDHGIRHEGRRYSFWYDYRLGTANRSFLSEEDLIESFDSCICGSQQIYYGWAGHKVYRCLLSALAVEFGFIAETPNEYVNLNEVSKAELLEFVIGYTLKGHLDACAVCTGAYLGCTDNQIPVAVQATGKEQAL